MAKTTQAQMLSLWLVATSARSAMPVAEPTAIALDDDATLLGAAGIDVGPDDRTATTNQQDVRTARDFLIANAARAAAARQLFVDAISALSTDPTGPSNAQLQALSALPPA